jgi:hypothetical protein
MTYTTSFSLQFAQDFARFPVPDQLKVTTFLTQFESFGLQSFSNYPGKIAPSWSGPATAANHAFARNNDLWHYHIGIPKLKPTQHGKYFTSDWLLHFQWPHSCGGPLAAHKLRRHLQFAETNSAALTS